MARIIILPVSHVFAGLLLLICVLTSINASSQTIEVYRNGFSTTTGVSQSLTSGSMSIGNGEVKVRNEESSWFRDVYDGYVVVNTSLYLQPGYEYEVSINAKRLGVNSRLELTRGTSAGAASSDAVANRILTSSANNVNSGNFVKFTSNKISVTAAEQLYVGIYLFSERWHFFNPIEIATIVDELVITRTCITPAAPTVAGNSRCGNGTVQLTASGAPAGYSYRWYEQASGGTAIAGARGATFTTPSLSASKTYYVAVANDAAGCTIESTRVPVMATVNPTPIASLTGPADVYIGKTETYNYTGSNKSGIVYTLNLDGGTLTSGAVGQVNQIKWDTPGVKNIRLAVTIDGCTSAEFVKQVTVHDYYTWTGQQNDSWNVAANWLPNGVPGADDAILVVNAPYKLKNNSGANVAVKKLMVNSGSLDLDGKKITVTGAAEFNGGEIGNGTGVDVKCKEVKFKGTKFKVPVFVECDNIYFNGSEFNNETSITKSGATATDNISEGGSVFNGPVTIINRTNKGLRLGNNTADEFKSDVTFESGSGGTLEASAILSGSTGQSIKTVGNAKFKSLSVNKSGSQVNLNSQVRIAANGNLKLTQGKIVSSAANPLILEAGATAEGASDNSFVEGPVQRFGAGNFTFPVGKGAVYKPISIAPVSATASDAFTAEYFPENSSVNYSHTSKDETIERISSCEHWILNRTAGSAHATVTLSWDANTACKVEVPEDLVVARWDGSKWQNHGNGGVTGTTTAGNVTSGAPITSFSPFAVGSKSRFNPLPVELVSFAATGQHDKVHLKWSTASEQENKGFSVERSTDGKTFSPIAFVNGAGNSSVKKHYTFADVAPVAGTAYYRLRQVDFDGTVTYSRIVTVYLNADIDFTIVPNPVKDRMQVSWSTNANETNELTIMDAGGRELLREQVKSQSIIASITIDMSGFTKGLYILRVTDSKGVVHTCKLVKQ